jgi:hypothetical protein
VCALGGVMFFDASRNRQRPDLLAREKSVVVQ